MILILPHVLRISQFRNNTWFYMVYHKPFKGKLNLIHRYTIHVEIDILICKGLIIKSRYYDFNDTTCIANISLEIKLMV